MGGKLTVSELNETTDLARDESFFIVITNEQTYKISQKNMMKAVLNTVFRVGMQYITGDGNFNPTNKFGGTWTLTILGGSPNTMYRWTRIA